MTITFTDLGETNMLSTMVGKHKPENLIIRLFVNDIVPKPNRQQDQFTEATPLTYRYALISPDMWEIKKIKVNNKEELCLSAIAKWEFSGWSDHIYGYYAEGETSGIVKFYSRFEEPYNIGVEGGSITNVLQLFLKNINI